MVVTLLMVDGRDGGRSVILLFDVEGWRWCLGGCRSGGGNV